MATLTLLLKKQELGNTARPTVHSAWHYRAGKQVSVKGRAAGWCAFRGELRGEETFSSIPITFSLEFNSSQLGRMKNSDFLYLFWNNKPHTPREGRLPMAVGSGWGLWTWLRGRSSKGSWSQWRMQSPVPTGSQSGFLGPPDVGEPCHLLVGSGGRKSLSYEDKDSLGSLCSFRADFYFPVWWGSRFQAASKHNTVPSDEEMKPFKSSVPHVVPSPAAFRLTEAFC